MTESDRMDRPPSIVLSTAALSDTGRVREENQDRFVVAELYARGAVIEGSRRLPLEKGPILLAVADGMGGEAAGGVASEIAVESLVDALAEGEVPTSHAEAATRLREAILLANRLIHEQALRHPEFQRMGTTLTAMIVLGDAAVIGQVGDSRAYLIREGRAVQLTRDQSLLQHLIDIGRMTPEEAERSEQRNIILQALGPTPSVDVDVTIQSLRRGDLLLLCSDGLSGLLAGEELAMVLGAGPSLEAGCAELVALANARGGEDNITVVTARIEGEGVPLPGIGDAVGHRTFEASA